MTRNLFAMLENKLVETAVTAARPSAPGDGVDVTSWRTNGFSGASAAVMLKGSAAATVTSPTDGAQGVELWGYVLGKWRLIVELRDGRDITVDADRGYAQEANVIGVFERLAIAGTVSAGAVTGQIAPIEGWS